MTLPSARNITNNSVAAKPPMTDKEIRLECLKQAVILGGAPSNVISLAGSMFEFVITP